MIIDTTDKNKSSPAAEGPEGDVDMEDGEEEMSESEEEVAGGGRPAMGRKSKFIQDEVDSDDYGGDEEGEEEVTVG